jgi:hypothetical protein
VHGEGERSDQRPGCTASPKVVNGHRGENVSFQISLESLALLLWYTWLRLFVDDTDWQLEWRRPVSAVEALSVRYEDETVIQERLVVQIGDCNCTNISVRLFSITSKFILSFHYSEEKMQRLCSDTKNKTVILLYCICFLTFRYFFFFTDVLLIFTFFCYPTRCCYFGANVELAFALN